MCFNFHHTDLRPRKFITVLAEGDVAYKTAYLNARNAEIIVMADKIDDAPTSLLLVPIASAMLRLMQVLRQANVWNSTDNTFVFAAREAQGRDVMYSRLNGHFNTFLRKYLGFEKHQTAHYIRSIVVADASARFGANKTQLEQLARAMRHSLGTANRFYNIIAAYSQALEAQRALLDVRGQLKALPLLAHPPSSQISMAAAGHGHLACGVFTPCELPPIPAVPERLVRLIEFFLSLTASGTAAKLDESDKVEDEAATEPEQDDDDREPDVRVLLGGRLHQLGSLAIPAEYFSAIPEAGHAGPDVTVVDDNPGDEDESDINAAADDDDGEDEEELAADELHSTSKAAKMG